MASCDIAEAMEADLTVTDAAAHIVRLEGLRDALLRRNIGITWMIFGIVTAGIFVNYDFVGLLSSQNPDIMWLFPILWMPWVLMGVLACRGVWKSAGMVFPGMHDRRAGIIRGLMFFIVSFAAFWATYRLGLPLVEPAVFLGVVGIVSLGFGLTGIACYDRTERMLQAFGGVLMIAVAIVPSLFLATRDDAYMFFSFVAPGVAALVYFVIGLFLTMRG